MRVDGRSARMRGWALSVLCMALAVAVGVGCRVTDWTLWQPDNTSGYPVDEIRGINYLPEYSFNPRIDRDHQLDVFVPHGKKDCPVVVLVHGGAWIMGDNRCCGLYSSVGQFLASQGIIAVLPNYRLSPAVKHPEHIRDVALAVRWTKYHVHEYGGRDDELVLMGHSAGGHLVSLLATDDQYLSAVGVSPSLVKGVISISGVYVLTPGKMNFTLGGHAPDSMRCDKMVPLRGDSDPSKLPLPGIPLKLDVFEPAFGTDPQIRIAASPISHVHPGLPPFLLCYADNDLPSLPEMAEDFQQALLAQKGQAELLLINHRNHNSIIFQAIRPDDPISRAVLQFIHRHLSEPPR